MSFAGALLTFSTAIGGFVVGAVLALGTTAVLVLTGAALATGALLVACLAAALGDLAIGAALAAVSGKAAALPFDFAAGAFGAGVFVFAILLMHVPLGRILESL